MEKVDDKNSVCIKKCPLWYPGRILVTPLMESFCFLLEKTDEKEFVPGVQCDVGGIKYIMRKGDSLLPSAMQSKIVQSIVRVHITPPGRLYLLGFTNPFEFTSTGISADSKHFSFNLDGTVIVTSTTINTTTITTNEGQTTSGDIIGDLKSTITGTSEKEGYIVPESSGFYLASKLELLNHPFVSRMKDGVFEFEKPNNNKIKLLLGETLESPFKIERMKYDGQIYNIYYKFSYSLFDPKRLSIDGKPQTLPIPQTSLKTINEIQKFKTI